MTTLKLKQDLHRYLDEINDKNLLVGIQSFIAEYEKRKKHNQQNPVKPMTMQEYYAMIEEGENDIRTGNVHSEEEMEKYFKAI